MNNADIKRVRIFAVRQMLKYEVEGVTEGMIGFVDEKNNGQFIINPWTDGTARFELTDDEAVKEYGLVNVMNFVSEVLNELEANEH